MKPTRASALRAATTGSHRRVIHWIGPLVITAGTVAMPTAGAEAAPQSVNCDAGGNLQAKIDAASSGSTILIKGTCLGNFTITSKALTLQGHPTAVLDGADVFRPLGINNTATPGRSVHLVGLTITGGVTQAPGGGGILKIGGGLTLTRVTVTGNLTSSSSGPIAGGGIFAGGNISLTDSTVADNRARTTAGGGEADGGGISVVGGTLTVTDSIISGNRATAALSSGSAVAKGGGFYVDSGHFSLKGAKVLGNRVAASGPANSDAEGGGGRQNGDATDSIVGSTIAGNAATAEAPAGTAQAGAAGISDLGLLHVTGSSLSGNRAQATGSSGNTLAGGVLARTLTLTRSTVNGNRLVTVTSGGLAHADGGGVYALTTTATIVASTISRNSAIARSSGAFNALVSGGGVLGHDVTMTNSTVAFNRLSATSAGGDAQANGGGLDADPGSFVDSTIAGNTASAAGGTTLVRGGGLFTTPGMALEATVIAGNTAPAGPDCSGGPTSHGDNLIRKASGCSFQKKPSDLIGKDPKLGPLANNGGPTRTMAIAPTSPARDAVPAPCAVGKDQRGVHRPQGAACDIGAYERKLP